MKAKIYFLILLALISNSIYGSKYLGKTNQSNYTADQIKYRAEGCSPATASTELSINNVRCRINTGGDMWWDLNGNAQYFIPANSLKTSMFAGSIWMAGIDENGQLKCAAQRYRGKGNDFWPGPLSADGLAKTDIETCEKYDKLYKISKAEVSLFRSWYAKPSDYPGYQIPTSILEWPAHGDLTKDQDEFLAPFFDMDGDDLYNPYNGDYPYYDLDGSSCGDSTGAADRILYGDQTIWWVFNDKGNNHTESGGAPIGIEIRAQAYGFATNDEINNATFYNFLIYNRSTTTLTNTYFSLWADTDLGYGNDDYIGCDVMRGLGYCYNGDAIDGNDKANEYGENPPAIGVDFIQGPYLDPNGRDDYFPFDITEPDIIPDLNDPSWNGINGINFGDGIRDNERLGMRRFVYHDNIGGSMPWYMTDPETASDYYNLLRGIWKDGQKMKYGGNGHPSVGSYGSECDFMFPGESDVYNWGTAGVAQNPKNWTEVAAGNTPYDRRIMQSTGPFTLKPGATNHITVAIPWARTNSGGNLASVEALKIADDKCQKMFENCFRSLNGPDAPDINITTLDQQLILTLQNSKYSNNYKELYPYDTAGNVTEFDYKITTPDSLSKKGIQYNSLYKFQGYLIYQLRDKNVSIKELQDINKARLVAQCDIQDQISNITNYEYDPILKMAVPVEKVKASNNGIVHSFRITEDFFASDNNKVLINNKKYYYTAIAYAYNNFKNYDSTDLNTQTTPFISSCRNGIDKWEIRIMEAVPNKKTVTSEYGFGPKITRLEGNGNGGLWLELTPQSTDQILNSNTSMQEEIEYLENLGPIKIKVIDPLNVPKNDYLLKFDTTGTDDDLTTATWSILEENKRNIIANSENSINIKNEQIIPSIGLSVTIQQTSQPGKLDSINQGTYGFLGSSITYQNPNDSWLGGIQDTDDSTDFNWIRSGSIGSNTKPQTFDDYSSTINGVNDFTDPYQFYEKILNKTWAPFCLAARTSNGPGWNGRVSASSTFPDYPKKFDLQNIGSVDIVMTSDKSKWTRCIVLEMCNDKSVAEGGQYKFLPRKGNSKDKDGNNDGTGTGFSWFPGYAICVETGERLNMAFGEDSGLKTDHGGDMIFNPSSVKVTDLYNSSSVDEKEKNIIFGGKHYVYIFGHNGNSIINIPAYDSAKFIYKQLSLGLVTKTAAIWKDCWYVGCPMPIEGYESKWLSNDVCLKIRVKKPYSIGLDFARTSKNTNINQNLPLYRFNTMNLAANINTAIKAEKNILFPNPTCDMVYISDIEPNSHFSLFDTQGSVIKNGIINNNSIDVSKLANGVYILKIYNEKLSKSLKFVKK